MPQLSLSCSFPDAPQLMQIQYLFKWQLPAINDIKTSITEHLQWHSKWTLKRISRSGWKERHFPHLSLLEQLWLQTTPSCWFLLVPNPQLMDMSGLTQNDGLQIYTQTAVYIYYNQTFCLIAILINILSEQNQVCSTNSRALLPFPWRSGNIALARAGSFPPCSTSVFLLQRGE